MREATIGGRSALDEVRPGRPVAASGRGGGQKPARAVARDGRWARLRRFRARATLLVGSAGFSVLMIGIVLNATVWQKGHHPAPLFASAPPVVAARTETAPPPAPVPVAPPLPVVEPSLPPVAPQSEAPAASPPVVPHRAVHAAATSHPGRTDAIARLLGTVPNGEAPAHARPGSVHAGARPVPVSPHAKLVGAVAPLAASRTHPPTAVN